MKPVNAAFVFPRFTVSCSGQAVYKSFVEAGHGILLGKPVYEYFALLHTGKPGNTHEAPNFYTVSPSLVRLGSPRISAAKMRFDSPALNTVPSG